MQKQALDTFFQEQAKNNRNFKQENDIYNPIISGAQPKQYIMQMISIEGFALAYPCSWKFRWLLVL